jgi:hypothetical protein
MSGGGYTELVLAAAEAKRLRRGMEQLRDELYFRGINGKRGVKVIADQIDALLEGKAP